MSTHATALVSRPPVRTLPLLFGLLLTSLLLTGAQLAHARTADTPPAVQAPGFAPAEIAAGASATCKLSDSTACIAVELVTVTVDDSDPSNVKRTYSIEVTNSCQMAISNVAFQLPTGVMAASPADGATYTGPNLSGTYTASNTSQMPFPEAFKFEAQTEGPKNGQSETFTFTLDQGHQLNNPFMIEVKYGTNRDQFMLNTSCGVVDQGDVCYLVADNDGFNGGADAFTYYNKVTKSETAIGATGTLAMEAIAFYPGTSTLYAAHQDGSVGRFGTVDLATGAFTEIGVLGSGDGAQGTRSFADPDGLAIEPSTGRLYATIRKGTEDLLIRIDPATGDAVDDAFGPGVDYVVVQPFNGLDDIDDLAFDPFDGQLYAILNENGQNSRLVTLDMATGAVTDVAALDVPNVEGLTFDNDGTILGVTGNGDREVRVIDRATGTTTLDVSLGVDGNRDYEGIACLTRAPNAISGTVYEDLDADGQYDVGEPGTGGVTVELYRDVNNDDAVDAGDVFLTSLDTDMMGNYFFMVSADGHFALKIDTGDLPATAFLTTDNAEEASFAGFGLVDDNNNFGYRLPGPTPPGPDQYCVADRLTQPYGFWLPGLDAATSGPYYAITESVFTEATDGSGTATFTGRLTNDLGESLYIYATLTGRTTAPPPGSPKQAGGYTVTGDDFVYYTGIDGTLYGEAGSRYDGAVITFAQRGEAFQFGTGANLFDQNELGAGAWISTTVVQQPTTSVTLSGGNADINVTFDASCNVLATTGDRVFKDDDQDGLQDAGEAGVSGADVTLWYADPQGNLLDEVGTTTTDASGLYGFTSLVPAHYVTVFAAMPTMPFTTADAGADDALDSDADPATGRTTVRYLGANDVVDTIDAGVITPVTNTASIGDTVFEDTDGNGVQDAGEPGLGGVTVTLYTPGPDATCGTADDVQQATATTDASGTYTFTGLAPGTYCVDPDAATAPAGSTLTTGNDPQTVTLADGQVFVDADFGYQLAPVVTGIADLEVEKWADNATPPPGSVVTFDIVLTNQGPDTATNITVWDPLPFGLTYAAHSTTAGSFDSSTGFWTLPSLAMGDSDTLSLQVTVEDAVDGYQVENTAQVIRVDQDDPDSTPGNGVLAEDDMDNAVLLIGGAPDGTADLSVTKEVDESAPALNEVVTFTIVVSNDGPDDATDLVVRDVLPYGLAYESASPDAGTYDPATGFWEVGTLTVGSSATLELSTRVNVINMLENVAQVVFVDQDDPDSVPGNGVATEDDQDRALVEARAPIGSGGILRPDCADLGTVNVLAYDASRDVFYAGTENGSVHISDDNGENWPLFLQADAPVRDIVVAGSTIYAATYGEGVYASTDGGASWTALGPAAAFVNDLHHETTSGLLYAATDGAAQQYDGVSWTVVGAGTNPFAGFQLQALSYDAATSAVIATAPGLGTYAYTGTWAAASTGLPTGRVNALALGPNGEVLAGTNSDGVYAYSGGAWAAFGTGLETEPVQTVTTGVGGEVLAGTRERGFYAYDAGTWSVVPNLPVYTVSAVTINSFGQYFAGTPGEGIFRYFDANGDGTYETWQQVSGFLVNAVVQGLVVAPNGDLFAATYGHGVLYSNDGGQCWTRMNRGLENLWTYDIVRRSDGTLFIGIWADGLGGVWRSTDDGRNWEYLDLGNRQILALAIDPANEDVIYAGANLSGEGSVFRSADGGETWTQLGGVTTPAWAIDVEGSTVVVGTQGDGVFRSTDGGATFTQIGAPASGLTDPNVFALRYGPAGSSYAGTLFAGTTDGVFAYDGLAWSRYGTGTEGHEVRTLAFSGTAFFAGTWDAGVVEYDVNTGTWEDFGLADTPVVAFAVNPTDQTLLIGTSGQGVFLAPGAMRSTSVEDADDGAELPADLGLGQNYPNPFNPQTTIAFTLPDATPVRLAVYDLLGREVEVLADGVLSAGQHQVTFEAGDLASGTYLYRLVTPQRVLTRTLTLLK